MVYIPWSRGGIWKQAIVTKELLLEAKQYTKQNTEQKATEGLQFDAKQGTRQNTKREVEGMQQESNSICGVAYNFCIEAVYNALVGQESETHQKSQFEKAAREHLHWLNDKFERIFNQRLNAKVLEELTDKIV